LEDASALKDRRHNLLIRARMIQAIRRFFIDRDYLDIETPLRVPTLAPESHIDAVPSDGWFLQTSPELCMKRLLAAGYSKIFQISKCFRGAERGRLHVPEFTMIEWYRSGADYRDLMDECEDLVIFVAGQLAQDGTVTFRGNSIELERPWERISVRDAFLRHASVTMEKSLENDSFDEVMVTEIEPCLGRGKPTFLYDYPASRAALARKKKDDQSIAERFEIYMGGLELANAFSELTDPDEQRLRFDEEQAYRRQGGRTAYPPAEKFLQALAHMPASAGIALGIDRLAMIFTDSASIDDVVAFTPEEL